MLGSFFLYHRFTGRYSRYLLAFSWDFLHLVITVKVSYTNLLVSLCTSPMRILGTKWVGVITDTVEVKLCVIQPRETKNRRTSTKRRRGLNQLN